MAVGDWGLAPSEFWELTPTEFWHIHKAKTPPKTIGKNGLTEERRDQLLDYLDEAQEEWQSKQKSAGSKSGSEPTQKD